MSWYRNIIPDAIKKNVCAYLIQRYLGNFFEEKLTREQLDVDFYNGKGSIGKISLDVEALNELGEKQNWPLEFIDGYIEKLYIEIPWTTIFSESCYVQVDGLKLTFQPKQRSESAESVFESMWNSMTSSMHLAEECAKSDTSTEGQSTTTQTFEGIEIFAQTIDTILSRIKVQFINTVIQVEHVPQGSSNGVGIVIHVDLIHYSDESGNDPPPAETTDLNQESKKGYLVNSFATKRFRMQGITLSTVEFSIKDRTICHSIIDPFVTTSAQQIQQKHNRSDTIDEMIDSVANEVSSSSLNESTSDSEEREEEDCVEDEKRCLIKFAQFQSQHEIRVKLKQSENITGPKVSIDITLGSLIFFLSPRQFHVLLELANGFCCPDNEDHSNIATKARCISKPMTVIDYERVHQELQQNLMPGRYRPSENLKGQQTWSSGVIDESDSDENFLPLKNTVGSMYDSTISGVSSSMESSVNSSMSAFTDQSQQQRNDRRSNLDCDPTAEISHFNIRIASVAGILLHEDILTPSSTPGYVLAPAAVKQMQNIAELVFEQCDNFSINLCGGQNFDNVQKLFDNVCKLNHLRLIAAPLQLEGDEKTTLSTFSISAKLIAVKLGFYECIYDAGKPSLTPLLMFIEHNESMENPNVFTAKPSFTMHLKYVEKRRKQSKIGTNTDIVLSLNKCNMEVDISIVDRITALLHPPPICIIEKNRFAGQKPAPLYAASTDSKINFKLTSPFLSAKIRFPIPDFRPSHDMNRVPWWKPNLRSDYLLLNLTDAIAETTILSRQDYKLYNIDCKSIDIYYSESEKGTPIHLANIGSSEDDDYDLRENRLSIKINKDSKSDSWEEEDEDAELNPLAHSVYGAFETQGNRYPGPFSAKRVVHESDTPHSKPYSNDAEELIFPGDKNEIDDFVKQTIDNSRIELYFKLSTVSLQLISKHIYELIYNRINNDLFLWKPSAPRGKSPDVIQTLIEYGAEDDEENFTACKSAIQYDSSDSESSEDDKIFYSTYDSNLKNKNFRVKEKKTKLPSYISINLSINEGVVVVHSPVRDATTNNVIPCQQSELQLNVKNANVFIVSGYRGDENLGFVCAQIADADLYHCEMMSTPNEVKALKKFISAVDQHLHPTIYKSEPGMLAAVKNRGGNREMFSVAVRIQAQHETHHVKTVRVSMALNKATLRHRMCSEPNSWISQIMDFFNVQDYPIAGYTAKDVLTELHLHLWDCAIDYRPLYLPLRSTLCLGTFSMSSHLSAQANTSTLRFIAEECNLFLSEKYASSNGIASVAPVDLKRDYINVIDIGLFEMSLKTNDKRNGLNPHIDLRASNNIINIHTCSDSGHALMQLLIYLANNGDLNQEDKKLDSPFSSPRHQPSSENEESVQELVNVEQGISNLSSSQHQKINELLGEAMNDISESNENNFNQEMHTNPGTKVFYFPDENQIALAQEALEKPLAQVKDELGDVAYLASNKSSDTDDDFCIIGCDAGLGLLTKNGEPVIRWLINEPLRVVENHFSEPVTKVDVLQPPKHFPIPVMKYTLCEMSIIWNIYGGNDFKLSSEAKDRDEVKKRVNFENTVSFNKSGSHNEKVFFNYTNMGEDKKKQLSWLIKGGLNRDHSTKMEIQLNKIKFQHEVYPENTSQASRQIIIVNEVEIRDRLQSNKIDKFLHQYTSEARPKQSYAHMISIRALHSRLDPNLPTQECSIKISLLPIKLNIDQDALLFLIKFFSELSGPSDKNADLSLSSKHNTPTHQPPVMTVNETKEQDDNITDESLLIFLDENKKEIKSEDQISHSCSQDSLPIYFRQVVFSPEMLIRLDYMGKHVDMTHGKIPGLLMGLAQLNSSEIRLKRISYRHGLLGVDKLVNYLLQEWLNDIKGNQLPSLLVGVGPMHSLVQLFQGIRDLFWLPIEQYQKDGRIVRGLQRGANSFTTSTAMAALELTSRLIHLIQVTAETAYDMLSPGPSVRRIKGKRKRYHQPQDIREGMTNAFNVMREGIGQTAENIVQVASLEKEQKGYSGAVGSVLRQIPPNLFKPIILVSEAAGNVLTGMQSQLVPDTKTEANQKWRNEQDD